MRTRELDLLKSMRLLTIQTMEKMVEGCETVRNEKDIHKDAKDLARLVIKDCNNLLLFLKEK